MSVSEGGRCSKAFRKGETWSTHAAVVPLLDRERAGVDLRRRTSRDTRKGARGGARWLSAGRVESSRWSWTTERTHGDDLDDARDAAKEAGLPGGVTEGLDDQRRLVGQAVRYVIQGSENKER